MASSFANPKQGLGESKLLSSTYLYRMGKSHSAGTTRKRALATPLMLTALVDAFSILVIFLLVQFSPEPNEFEVDGRLRLPVSESAETKDGSAFALIRIEQGALIFENRKYDSAQALISLLKAKNPSRVILASDGVSSFEPVGKAMADLAGRGPWTVEIAVEKAGETNQDIDEREAVELAAVAVDSNGQAGLVKRGRP